MASARVQLIIVAVLVCLFCGPVDSHCKPHTYALTGAINDWDKTFTFHCPPGQTISVVKSRHCSSPVEDRVWEFHCKSVPYLGDFTNHYWSEWVNEFDGVMHYVCPSGRVVTGFHSEHSNTHEDRRWKLRCSGKDGMTTSDHSQDVYANIWDGDMNYYVPSGFYIRGMHGYHDNDKEDRRYGFGLCRVQL